MFAFLKAVVLGIFLALIVSLFIGSGGSSGGMLNVRLGHDRGLRILLVVGAVPDRHRAELRDLPDDGLILSSALAPHDAAGPTAAQRKGAGRLLSRPLLFAVRRSLTCPNPGRK